MLTLPNIEDSPNFDGMAVRDSADYYAMMQVASGTGVTTSMSPVQNSGSNMEVTVPAGTYYVSGTKNVMGGLGAPVTIANASGTDRRDSVVAAEQGTLNATHTNGAGAITSIAVLALPVAIPSGATLLMPNGDNATTSAPASAGATSISINSYTPSTTITSGQPFTPLWAVQGTACGTAGWLHTSAGNPPVKPSTPTGCVLLGEVYVSSSTTVITTAANIVDKTALLQLGGQLIGTIDGNSQTIANLGSLLIGGSTSANTIGGMEIASAPTVISPSNQAYYGLNIADAPTFTTNNPGQFSAMLGVTSAWTVNKYSAFGQLYGMQFIPTITTGTSGRPLFFGGINCAPNLSGGGVAASGILAGVIMNPITNSTNAVPTMYGGIIGDFTQSPGSGIITTYVGLDIGVLGGLPTAGTQWALKVGQYNSFFNGLTTFGSTGSPTFAVHIQGTNGSGAIGLPGLTAQTQRNTSNSGSAYFYKGASSGNWFFITEFNKAGATVYTSYRVDSTGTITVTAGSALPT